MKKITLALLVLLLAFACFACGKDTAQQPVNSPDTQPSETVSQPVESLPAESSEVPSEEPSATPVPGVGDENEISAEKLAELSELFLYGDEPGNWYNCALAGASLGEYYNSPAEMDLYLLFYDGDRTEIITDEERDYLSALPDPNIVTELDVSKISRSKMDEELQTYFGVALADTQAIGLDSFTYYEPGDSYFLAHGDTVADVYTFVSGVEQENGDVTLYYCRTWDHEPVYCAVTLHLAESGMWQIVSNLPVTE